MQPEITHLRIIELNGRGLVRHVFSWHYVGQNIADMRFRYNACILFNNLTTLEIHKCVSQQNQKKNCNFFAWFTLTNVKPRVNQAVYRTASPPPPPSPFFLLPLCSMCVVIDRYLQIQSGSLQGTRRHARLHSGLLLALAFSIFVLLTFQISHAFGVNEVKASH